MALRLSTGFRNSLMGKRATAIKILPASASISFNANSGTNGCAQIIDTNNGLGIFTKNRNITVFNAANASNNGSFKILSVTPGIIEVPAGIIQTELISESDSISLVMTDGGSVSDLFRDGVIDIYSGSQPIDADSGETGTKLAAITLSSGDFVPGEATNGLNFDVVVSGVLSKSADEVWSGVGLSQATAGWFRLYDNSRTEGVSSTAIRLDGNVATSGAQLNISNPTITVGGTTTVDSIEITMPSA